MPSHAQTRRERQLPGKRAKEEASRKKAEASRKGEFKFDSVFSAKDADAFVGFNPMGVSKAPTIVNLHHEKSKVSPFQNPFRKGGKKTKTRKYLARNKSIRKQKSCRRF